MNEHRNREGKKQGRQQERKGRTLDWQQPFAAAASSGGILDAPGSGTAGSQNPLDLLSTFLLNRPAGMSRTLPHLQRAPRAREFTVSSKSDAPWPELVEKSQVHVVRNCARETGQNRLNLTLSSRSPGGLLRSVCGRHNSAPPASF